MILHNDVEKELKLMKDSSAVLTFLQKLERYPGTLGDHYELGLHGEPIQLKVLKRHVLVYFRDPFANETRVLDLVHVEQGWSRRIS